MHLGLRSYALGLVLAAAGGSWWLAAQTRSGSVDITVNEGTMIALALSPDKSTIAIDLQGALYTLPVSGGPAKPITDLLYDAHQPSWSPDGKTIAFYSNRDDRWHIWAVGADGSHPKQLTSGAYEDREPHWSPDGTRIAFSSNRSGNGSYDIWELTVASGKLRQVTKGAGNEFNPTWSPDGREIAYVSSQSPEGVYAVNVADGHERLLTAASGTVGTPSWSPDGKRVLYTVVAQGDGALMIDGQKVASGEDVFPFRAAWLSATEFLYTADGKIKRRSLGGESASVVEFRVTLPVMPANYSRRKLEFDSTAPQPALGIMRPVISPDGKQVAFAALGDLWVMPIGGKPRRLTDDAVVEMDPAWSPDGVQLSYSSDRAGSMDVYVRDLKTGKDRQLTESPGVEKHGAWSPNGKYIAFIKEMGSTEDVFVVDTQTGVSKKVHDGGYVPGYPTWSPDSRIVVSSRFMPASSRFRQGTSQLFATTLDGGSGRLIVPVPEHSIGKRIGDGPVWSPDGKQMSFEMDGALYVMPVTSAGDAAGKPRMLAKGPVDHLSWTGDSQRILYVAPDGLSLITVGSGAVQKVPVDLDWKRAIPRGLVMVHAGRLVDGVHESARTDMDIAIEGNRIRAVVSHDAGNHTGTVIDASDQSVMPGLIEAHAHTKKIFGNRFGRLMLAYGITSVRSPSNAPADVVEDREAFESGRRHGPRLFAAPFSLDGPLGYYAGAIAITTNEQVDAQLVRANAFQLDMLKTYVNLAEPLRKHAVEGAHQAGIPVSSHELYPAAAFGMDSTEHLTGTAGRGYPTKCSTLGRMYQDVIEILRVSRMTITPTAVLGGLQGQMARDKDLVKDPRWSVMQPAWVTETQSGGGRGRGAAGGDAATRKAVAAGWRKAILDMTRAGVSVLAGTDSSLVPYGISLHYELEIEVAAGLTPFQALQTATVNPARLLNASRDLGTVEVGKLADLVIVDGDPLQDIRNARKVRTVIRGGSVIQIEELVKGD